MADERLPMASGLAALAVCEALAVALVECGVLRREDATQALENAISMHRNSGDPREAADLHVVAAGLVERIKRSVEWPVTRN